MSDKKNKADEPSYAAASAELDQILQEIESGEIDLDVLYDKVERAAALLALCRDKLAATQTKVQKVVANLATALGDADEEATDQRDEE